MKTPCRVIAFENKTLINIRVEQESRDVTGKNHLSLFFVLFFIFFMGNLMTPPPDRRFFAPLFRGLIFFF